MDQVRIPAVFMRGGTSNAVMFRAADLPPEQALRDAIFRAALGSPDPWGRQLDGMGGGISSLSKVCIVGPATHPEADLDYTFAQVGVRDGVVDYGASCGNMSSAIGPFALDEGLLPRPGPGRRSVTALIHNTNTGKLIRARFEALDGRAAVEGPTRIPGVPGTGSPIDLEFPDPGGSRTGHLFPAGAPTIALPVPGLGRIPATLIDATSPFVFVPAGALECVHPGLTGAEDPAELDATPALMQALERIRRAAGVRMGLGESPEAIGRSSPGAPKVGVVAPPREARTLDGTLEPPSAGDLSARIVSMGNVHRALPLTGALALGVAAAVPGSVVAANLAAREPPPPDPAPGSVVHRRVRLMSPSGVIEVASRVRQVAPPGAGAPGDGGASGWEAIDVSVRRTARRLFEGAVLVPRSRVEAAS